MTYFYHFRLTNPLNMKIEIRYCNHIFSDSIWVTPIGEDNKYEIGLVTEYIFLAFDKDHCADDLYHVHRTVCKGIEPSHTGWNDMSVDIYKEHVEFDIWIGDVQRTSKCATERFYILLKAVYEFYDLPRDENPKVVIELNELSDPDDFQKTVASNPLFETSHPWID